MLGRLALTLEHFLKIKLVIWEELDINKNIISFDSH